MTVKGQGAAYRFLADLVGHQGDECIQWPFSRDKHGRGMLGHNGKRHWAHRLMCELAQGPAPTPKHKAAHDCGKGHEGCINPKHLAWKTQKENLADCVLHGTQGRHRYGPVGKLKHYEVEEIRSLRDTMTQGALAARYGVSEGTINDIWRGRTWVKKSKVEAWTEEQVRRLREGHGKMTGKELAAYIGKPYNAVFSKLCRLDSNS